jgi:hypothetical protein
MLDLRRAFAPALPFAGGLRSSSGLALSLDDELSDVSFRCCRRRSTGIRERGGGVPTSEDSASVSACVASSMDMNGGFNTGAEDVRRWPAGSGEDAPALEAEVPSRAVVGFKGGASFGVELETMVDQRNAGTQVYRVQALRHGARPKDAVVF